MSDRTYVTLHILKEHKEKVEKIYNDYGYNPNNSNHIDEYEDTINNINVVFITLEFDEVNYGNLPFLDELLAQGIAYTSEFEAGGDFDAGSTTLRFSEEGEASIKTLYPYDYTFSMDTIKKALDTPTPLASVQELVVLRSAEVHVLPFINQIEYGKVYLANKLLSG